MLFSYGVGVTRFLDKEQEQQNKGFLPGMSEEELTRRVNALINRQGGGDAGKAVALLLRDNAEIRDKNRKANEALEIAGKSAVKPEDVTELAEFRKLKLKPEELVALQKENKDLKDSGEKANHKLNIRAAAKVLGVNEEVLEDQLTLKQQHLEMRDVHVSKDGKVVVEKMPYTRPKAEANGPLQPASEWIATLGKPYQEALKAGIGEGNDKDGLSVVPFVSQGSADKAPPSGKVKAVATHIQATYGELPFETPSGKPAKQGA